jgi:hypothetical protein
LGKLILVEPWEVIRLLLGVRLLRMYG